MIGKVKNTVRFLEDSEGQSETTLTPGNTPINSDDEGINSN